MFFRQFNKKTNKHASRQAITITVLSSALLAFSASGEQVTTAEEQSNLHVTIYNSNIALVKDVRDLALPEGDATLAFKDVSAQIMPESAILTAKGVTLLEQNFEYDLLSPESLLNKFVGKSVTLERRVDDKQITEQATILANNNAPVFKVGDKIRTGTGDDRIVFDEVPSDLRERPTLTMLLNNSNADKQPVTLSYLTSGLSWRANYVASLTDDNTLNLKGWVTLNNNSGVSYHNAHLQLVAGEVNRVQQHERAAPMMMKAQAMPVLADAQANMQEESLFEYHLYSLPRQTTIKDKQDKQVSLLQADDVPYQRQLIIDAHDPIGFQSWRGHEAYQTLTADAKIVIDNKKDKNLGMPIPAGIIRTYQKDSKGNMQFIGEDNVKHTPENEQITLKLGEAFDITAKRKQTDYQQETATQKSPSTKKTATTITASYEVIFKNAKDQEASIDYREHFQPNWTIEAQSSPSEKLNSTLNRWQITVPPKGEKKLTFTVKMVR